MFDQPFPFFANFGEYERALSAAMVIMSMLGMGATLTVRDFTSTLYAWKGLAVGMVAQLLLVPAWAGLMMFVLGLFPAGFGGLSIAGAVGIATGLALVAAMPGGSLSNLLTFIGNGNVALSVALTAITTFVCLVVTPVVLASLITVQVPGNFDIDKSRIMLDIGLFLIAPLLVGMVVRVHANIQQQIMFTKLMVRASLCLLALIIIGSLGAGRLQFAPYGWLGPAIIIVFCIGAVYLARFAAYACGMVRRDSLAIIIEVAVKNGLLALLVLTSMFPSHMLTAQAHPEAQMIAAARDGCIFVVLFFSGIALITGIVSALRSRRILALDSSSSTAG
jgi:BASS family bile acid:Na+ symporter